VRGLKYQGEFVRLADDLVAPFTGAWIEMTISAEQRPSTDVAPFTGAWIEIEVHGGTREPGPVAPFTGAWIEIQKS